MANAFIDIASTYQAALNAHSYADKELLAFFEPFTTNPAFIPTGNNDVWIHIDNAIGPDGLQNLNSIYTTNTTDTTEFGGINSGQDDEHNNRLYWHTAPNNGVGKMYLQNYAAGVGGDFDRGTNIMPRGYSLFDAPVHDYVFIEEETTDEVGPTEPYPIKTYSTGVAAIDLNLASPVLGNRSLRMDSPSGAASLRFVTFANGVSQADDDDVGVATSAPHLFVDSREYIFGKYGINIPKGKKWILSWYARSNATSTGVGGVDPAGLTLDFWSANATHFLGFTDHSSKISSGAADHIIALADSWQRNWTVFDFASSATSVGLIGGYTGSGTTGSRDVRTIDPEISIGRRII